ncbi:MAG: Nif3-like dinuclear metal center hexameric protein [Chitinophagaceae bacterium]|nr:Nif3-like dinuclear metal center hexameric protein [Chitinophagaceae bacterium]
MTISDIAFYLESIAPLALQEDYDNAGLITGNPKWQCTGILCTLDVTEEVIAEAVSKNCNCIVAHHPIIFRGLKKITGSGHVEKAVISAIKNDVAIYAAHTNLDNIIDGVNGKIADKIGLKNRQVLAPLAPGTGAGLMGELDGDLPAEKFLQLLKKTFGLELVKYTRTSKAIIRRVAICGGAGSFLIPRALDAGMDAYVTADIRYHEFFGAEGRMLLCDIGHYESEQFTSDLLTEVLLRKFHTFAVLKSEVGTNPVLYFTGK